MNNTTLDKTTILSSGLSTWELDEPDPKQLEKHTQIGKTRTVLEGLYLV